MPSGAFWPALAVYQRLVPSLWLRRPGEVQSSPAAEDAAVLPCGQACMWSQSRAREVKEDLGSGEGSGTW